MFTRLMLSLMLLAVGAWGQLPRLEWPGIPVVPPGSGTMYLRVTYLPNGGVMMEPLASVRADKVWIPETWRIFEATMRTATEWCVDPFQRRLVASVFVTRTTATGVPVYVHWAIGNGVVMAEWKGCATGVRLEVPAFDFGSPYRVAVFASDAMPPEAAAVGIGDRIIAMERGESFVGVRPAWWTNPP